MLKQKKHDSRKKGIPDISLNACLAKTIHLESGDIPGVSVETHCRIVGRVARELITRMPKWLSDDLFPVGSELIAAAHDVGKISPTFQAKIYRVIGKGEIIESELDDRDIGRHYTVSQAAAGHCPKYIPGIIGRHHGVSAQSVEDSDAVIYGGESWQKKRLQMLQILKQDLHVDWPEVKNALQADVLAGLTVVSDWIGSGNMFDSADPDVFVNSVSESLDRAGFVTPKISRGLTFENIFNFSPREIQTFLSKIVGDSGIYVLEAPMGSGKTEAALYAAYKMLEESRATGIYFALPTQLTSDKVYERMNRFLERILEESDSHRKALLLHGAAWLRETEFGEDGLPGHSWFNCAKRGLLAPFAVGTIDQALMAVMNVKYGFVRTFGLAGKVVILDEVHSYDSYTGTILKELVTALRKLHCTVIILSATLTDKQRYSIMGINNTTNTHSECSVYPLISALVKEKLKETVPGKIDNSKVCVSLAQKDADAVEEVLKRAERGEQILWIENTVSEAQERFCQLASRSSGINVDCGLLHSRFIKTDRIKNEKEWAGIFGLVGREIRQKNGRILIGTQVLEQSLDIDADFMVTRICPTDMLFQRIGRLWRHRENDAIRPSEAKAEAWILAPLLDEARKDVNLLGKSAGVYSPYILCRTLEVWQERSIVNVPEDIRLLLEKTYADYEEVGMMAEYRKALNKERDRLRSFALISVSTCGKTLPEGKAMTRYSEIPLVEVLLIRKKIKMNSGILLKFLDGSEAHLPKFPEAERRRNVALEILRNTVMVPEYLAPEAAIKQLGWLKNYVYLGDDEESPFRVAVVADSGELRGLEGIDVSAKYNLNYDLRFGYRAVKKGRLCDAE